MEVQPLSREMIVRYLDSSGGEYEVDEDGDCSFGYDYEEACACELSCWLSVVGGDTYTIGFAEERSFPRSEWERIVWACNEWNESQPYPGAFLFMEDGGADEAGIRLEHSVYLPTGVTQEQLNALTEEIIESAFDFWRWAHDKHGL